MKFKYILFNILVLVFYGNLMADGLLVSSDTTYPGYLLRNRVTQVSVKINDFVAETVVYQEFVNDWTKTVDAVYSFPLPNDARSTAIYYTRNDTLFKAILKVQPQSINPGTGSGGIFALINKYMGKNVLKIELKDIKPGDLQKIELHYVSLLNSVKENINYFYPLDTKDFVTNPIDLLEFNIEVNSKSNITSFNIPSHPNFQTLVNEQNKVVLRIRKAMAYLTSDFRFSYKTSNESIALSSYSVNNDSIDGHFTLFLKAPSNSAGQEIPKNIIFVISRSSSMVGYKFEQSIHAISNALDNLTENDKFNIIDYDSYVHPWQPYLIPANASSIANAKEYLNNLSTGTTGNQFTNAITIAMNHFLEDNNSNMIVAFTDGRSTINPKSIRSSNHYNIGLFPIAIGDNVDNARLEMLASLNYGFATFIKEKDNINEKVTDVLDVINQPILKSPIFNFEKSDISNVLPRYLSTLFVGSNIVVSGRYSIPESGIVYVAGEGNTDTLNFQFNANFSGNTTDDKFPEFIWAKLRMDELEREIEIYGETQPKKDSLINLSLMYGMRCRYTAYIANYTNVISPVEQIICNITKLNDRIQLSWSTTFNSNIKGFEILKSFDGKNFVKIDYIASYETNGLNNTYYFNDFDLTSGAYYQIRQIDLDGNIVFSEILNLNGMGDIDFVLTQNYPNPFNPSTIISFVIPKSSFVTLKIYDVLGKEISNLVNEELIPGSYTKIWNAENLSSGVYFYTLKAGNFNQTKKMVLVR